MATSIATFVLVVREVTDVPSSMNTAVPMMSVCVGHLETSEVSVIGAFSQGYVFPRAQTKCSSSHRPPLRLVDGHTH